jgi:L-amino acid N-acyltransferase YncA
MDIVMRPVSLSDSERILRWRNSTTARNVSPLGREIDDSEHREWFSSRVRRISSEPYWMMTFNGNNVGFVRLDLSDNLLNMFTVSIFVDSEYRMLGIGRQMLRLAFDSITNENKDYEFRAIISRDNVSSIRLFKSFNFEYFAELDEHFSEYRRKSLSDAPDL